MKESRSNAERSRATRSALIDAARTLFLSDGFASIGTPQLVERAGLTRGALYHHFKDKQEVFRAVVEAEAALIAEEIGEGASDAATPLEALLCGADAYFRAMRVNGRVRLMLLEGPAVLGPEVMRQIDRETGGRELQRGLAEATGRDASDPQLAALSDLVSAMFDRAALAQGSEADEYRGAVETVLTTLVQAARQG